MTGILAGILLSALSLAAATEPAPASSASAKRLAQLLDRVPDGAVAVEDPGEPGHFVAARKRRGRLLVLSGRCASAEPVRRRLTQGAYRELYDTLLMCAVPATKILVQDVDADGLRPNLRRRPAADVVFELTSRRLVLDGDWRRHELDREHYIRACARLDARYRDLVDLLLAGFQR